MIRFLLDTDHIALQERAHPALLARLREQEPDGLAVSIVTVQESIRGRMALLGRQPSSARLVEAYRHFHAAVRFFQSINIVAFDLDCAQRVEELRALRLRVGTLDLRIAATALVHGFTLVTRNRQDFGKVPNLTIEDWSVAADSVGN